MAVEDTSPVREAYLASTEEGYKGRFVANIANIRLFKSNPYIKDEDEATLTELNKKLLKPYNGEQFYDDEGYIYFCKYIKNPITGAINYEYVSKEKETNDQLKYYESQGVLNQLMSAYNNGQVYKFYVDRDNLIAYPNTSLVFPESYVSYDIREQGLNENGEPVFVAGIYSTEGNTYKMALKPIIDTVKNTTYNRMCPAKLFSTQLTDRKSSINSIVNGNFYVVNFYSIDGEVVDTKLFQAVDSAIVNTAAPSQSVIDLRITVLRNNLPESSSNDMYPILTGENIQSSVSFIISAVYNDGTTKVITDKVGTSNLTITGKDDTSNGSVGNRYPVTFTYYPNVNENGEPISAGISKTITFQIVANASEILYKIIPVMWSDNETDFQLNADISKKIYKLKVYTLSTEGVLENKSRSFYDTMSKIADGEDKPFEAGSDKDCAGMYYDPYNQCVTFTFVGGNEGKDTIFNFKLYNESIATNYRFIARFGAIGTDVSGIYVLPLPSTSDYGYENDGPLSTLKYTYEIQGSIDDGVLLNNIIRNRVNDGQGFTFVLESHSEGGTASKDLTERYARYKNGKLLVPDGVQLVAVKDETCTNLTPVVPIAPHMTTVTLTAYNESTVMSIINKEVKTSDYIMAKFYKNSGKEYQELTLVNFDVFLTTVSH